MKKLSELKSNYLRNIEIRETLESGVTRKEAAVKYNMAIATISKLANNESFESIQSKLRNRILYLETIVEEFKNGRTSSELAEKYNTTKQNISRILKVAEVDRSDGGISKQKQDRLRKIVEYNEMGKTFNEICELLELEPEVVRNYAYEIGIKLRSDTKLRVQMLTEEILDLHKKGKTQIEISEELDVSQSYVSKILLMHNVRSLERPEAYEERDKYILKLYLYGKTVNEIVEETKLSEPNVRRILYKFI